MLLPLYIRLNGRYHQLNALIYGGRSTTKLQRFLDGYLKQDIERETYRFEKSKLLSEKKSLEEQSTRLEQKRTGWLEPMAEWIKEASSLPKIAQESNLFVKKVAAEKLFGSNLVLANREARLRARNSEFPCNPAKKSLVGALRRPLVSIEKTVEFPIGAFV